MKEPQYRDALAFGWRYLATHRFLWVYGLFAALLGQMGMFEVVGKIVSAVSRGDQPGGDVSGGFLSAMSGLLTSRWDLPPDGWVWLIWLLIIGVGMVVGLLAAAVISQGALIHAAAQGRTGRHPARDLREWRAGVRHFWRLASLHVVRKVVVAFAAFAVGAAAYSAAQEPRGIDLLVFLVLFLLAMAVGIFFSFFTVYAAGYIVVEEYTLSEAMAAATDLFRRHWLVSLEIGMIFFFIQVLLAGLVIAAFFILLIPSIVLWFFALSTVNYVLYISAIMFLVILFVAFLMLVGATFTVFTTSTWTYLFMKMHRHGLKSHLLRWASAS